MSGTLTSFRVVSIAAALAVVIGMSTLASAQSVQSVPTNDTLQGTAQPTAVDIDTPLALTVDTAMTTPLDKDVYYHRNFTFSGKANDVVTVTATQLSGNFGYDVHVNSQDTSELASITGSFIISTDLVVKLPQDGNYTVRVDIIDPGAGNSQAGSVSVLVKSGLPAGVSLPAIATAPAANSAAGAGATPAAAATTAQ